MINFIRKNKTACTIMGIVLVVVFGYYIFNVFAMNAQNEELRESSYKNLMENIEKSK